MPSILSQENVYQPTYRSNQYRVSVLDAQRFQVPVILANNIVNSINRPADPSLGVYAGNVNCQVVAPGIPTVITSPIPHGLVNGDVVRFNTVGDPNLAGITAQQHTVTVISPTQFSIPFDSTPALGPFQLQVLAFPRISLARKPTVLVYIHSKATVFNV